MMTQSRIGGLHARGKEFVTYDIISDGTLQAILCMENVQNFIHLRLASARIVIFIKDSR